jgi:hypothetical protein
MRIALLVSGFLFWTALPCGAHGFSQTQTRDSQGNIHTTVKMNGVTKTVVHSPNGPGWTSWNTKERTVDDRTGRTLSTFEQTMQGGVLNRTTTTVMTDARGKQTTVVDRFQNGLRQVTQK